MLSRGQVMHESSGRFGGPFIRKWMPPRACSVSIAASSRAHRIWRFLSVLRLGRFRCLARANDGELRLRVTDRDGFGVKSWVEPVSSEVPKSRFLNEDQVILNVATANSSLTENDTETLDPHRAGDINLILIGKDTIEARETSLPGRLYEGYAVLHPSGSEYQTQLVLDGVPLTDHRSPRFGPEIEADDVPSMSVYTAGMPAEYGRKMGGVIEIDTNRDPRRPIGARF
jgi:hypothetical protein